MTSEPAPLAINPSQAWDGNNGPWSTFTLGFGTPAQFTRVLISLTSVTPWAVLPAGCIPTDPADCAATRGGLFNPKESSTWKDEGLYTLVFEENLGYNNDDNGDFGYDTVYLGLNGTGAPTVQHQVIAGIATKDFYLGVWGVGPRPANFTDLDDPVPSLMSTLKARNLVPSLSYGYTAGAQYQLKQTLGSLTLGGYDASRFISNDVSFQFAADISRDLVVGIQSMTAHGINNTDKPIDFLPSPILSFIDPGVSHIWLPTEVCDSIASTFGLLYDPITKLYLVNETQHSALTAQNATIAFTIATDTSSTNTVDLVFPYASFDLELTPDYPGINATTRYFPIRQAANQTQYTLGRTFLQEVYLIADYERSNFSVHQCIFAEDSQPDLRTILPLSNASAPTQPSRTPNTPSSLKPGIKAVIAIVAAMATILLFGGWFLWYRRRRGNSLPTEEPKDGNSETLDNYQGKKNNSIVELQEDSRSPELESAEPGKPELDSEELGELQGTIAGHELATGTGPPYELAGGEVAEIELPEGKVRG